MVNSTGVRGNSALARQGDAVTVSARAVTPRRHSRRHLGDIVVATGMSTPTALKLRHARLGMGRSSPTSRLSDHPDYPDAVDQCGQ
jgi:hypothetical protein